MILSDGTFRQRQKRGDLIINPAPEDHQIQPASVDFDLGNEFWYFPGEIVAKTAFYDALDPFTMDIESMMSKTTYDRIVINPGSFFLGRSLQTLRLPHDLVCRVEGRSFWGRLGLIIHSTAAFIDPGWGQNTPNGAPVTLELHNTGTRALVLTAGRSIGQFVFETLDRKCQRAYGHPDLKSKYDKSTGVHGSRSSGTV